MKTKRGFIKLDHEFVDTAIEPLSSGATRLLLGLLRRFNGRNNGAIVFSVRQAATWCGCGKEAAMAHFRELQDQGLIVSAAKGHFRAKLETGKRIASTWTLTFLDGARA